MKKLLLLLVFLPIISFSQELSNVPFIDGKVQFESILEIKGKTSKELYSDVKLIISEIYNSGKAVIDVADEQGLFIVAKGNTEYPLKDFLGTINQKLDHSLKFQFKDEKIKLTFYNLSVNTIPFECIAGECKGYKFSKKIREEHIKQVKLVWENLLQTVINKSGKSSNDNW